MDAFRFAPELFETRTEVMVRLDDEGFQWLSHYSSIDPIHDEYGIEVCGIHDRDDAACILKILARMFPEWTHREMYYKDYGMELGWKAKVTRNGRRKSESWETA